MSAHVPESYGSPQYRIHCGEYLVVSKLSGARNQVGESVRPKGGSRGPSSRDGCGAPGNDADGFTPPEMFLASATATAPGAGSIR